MFANDFLHTWTDSDDCIFRNVRVECLASVEPFLRHYFLGWVNRFANAGDTAVEIAEATAMRVSIIYVQCNHCVCVFVQWYRTIRSHGNLSDLTQLPHAFLQMNIVQTS